MKKYLFFITTFLLLSGSTFAQNSIELHINHQLNEIDFAMNVATKNNLDHDFEVTRLEYYISEISIVHDGGMETAINDLWILVDASEATQVDLGSHPITEIEMVKFHIGVDEDHNHLDPSTYASQHPLAPKFPSMHWGWSPGYRFIAFEGNGGSNYDQLFQLHGLGDNNYFETVIELSTSAQNGQAVIKLDADYTRLLENIEVNTGVIVHGVGQEAQQTLENCRDFVFSAADLTNTTVDFSEINRFAVFPNPAENGKANIAIEASENLTYQITITTLLGRELTRFENVNSNSTLNINLNQTPGFYLVNLIKEGQTVLSQKLIIQ